MSPQHIYYELQIVSPEIGKRHIFVTYLVENYSPEHTGMHPGSEVKLLLIVAI